MNRLVNIFMNPAIVRPAIQNTAIFMGGLGIGASGYHVYSLIDSVIEFAKMDDQLFDETIQTLKDHRVASKEAFNQAHSFKQEILIAWDEIKKENEAWNELEKKMEAEKAKNAKKSKPN